jgi:hypothetical protein
MQFLRENGQSEETMGLFWVDGPDTGAPCPPETPPGGPGAEHYQTAKENEIEWEVLQRRRLVSLSKDTHYPNPYPRRTRHGWLRGSAFHPREARETSMHVNFNMSCSNVKFLHYSTPRGWLGT